MDTQNLAPALRPLFEHGRHLKLDEILPGIMADLFGKFPSQSFSTTELVHWFGEMIVDAVAETPEDEALLIAVKSELKKFFSSSRRHRHDPYVQFTFPAEIGVYRNFKTNIDYPTLKLRWAHPDVAAQKRREVEADGGELWDLWKTRTTPEPKAERPPQRKLTVAEYLAERKAKTSAQEARRRNPHVQTSAARKAKRTATGRISEQEARIERLEALIEKQSRMIERLTGALETR